MSKQTYIISPQTTFDEDKVLWETHIFLDKGIRPYYATAYGATKELSRALAEHIMELIEDCKLKIWLVLNGHSSRYFAAYPLLFAQTFYRIYLVFTIKNNVMYIVIETHGGPEFAIICQTPYGENEVWSQEWEAQEYSLNECQNGIVVEIN